MSKRAFIFAGQGAQYPGMGKEFADNYTIARETFEEADDILGRRLSRIIFEGPDDLLTDTKNSQVAIYVVSMAILRVIRQELPDLVPAMCAGLSLGEYTAVTASNKMSFADCLPLVQMRGQYMSDACETTKGGMAAILGLDGDAVEALVAELNLPNDLWVANFNCPKQVVISGTEKGVMAGMEAAKSGGARKAIPLQVHGAFHSGLMSEAQERLRPALEQAHLSDSPIDLVMNVTGKVTQKSEEIRQNLIDQVTHSVRWKGGIETMVDAGVTRYVEIGPGKFLAGFNKRMGLADQTVSVETVQDLENLVGVEV